MLLCSHSSNTLKRTNRGRSTSRSWSSKDSNSTKMTKRLLITRWRRAIWSLSWFKKPSRNQQNQRKKRLNHRPPLKWSQLSRKRLNQLKLSQLQINSNQFKRNQQLKLSQWTRRKSPICKLSPVNQEKNVLQRSKQPIKIQILPSNFLWVAFLQELQWAALVQTTPCNN